MVKMITLGNNLSTLYECTDVVVDLFQHDDEYDDCDDKYDDCDDKYKDCDDRYKDCEDKHDECRDEYNDCDDWDKGCEDYYDGRRPKCSKECEPRYCNQDHYDDGEVDGGDWDALVQG